MYRGGAGKRPTGGRDGVSHQHGATASVADPREGEDQPDEGKGRASFGRRGNTRGEKHEGKHTEGVRVRLAGALTTPWLAQRLGGGMGSEGACVSGLERSPAPTAPRCRRQGWGWARLRSEGAMREPEGCATACGAKDGLKYLETLAARHEHSDGGSDAFGAGGKGSRIGSQGIGGAGGC